MTNQNQSEVRYWTIYEGEYLTVTGPKGLKHRLSSYGLIEIATWLLEKSKERAREEGL